MRVVVFVLISAFILPCLGKPGYGNSLDSSALPVSFEQSVDAPTSYYVIRPQHLLPSTFTAQQPQVLSALLETAKQSIGSDVESGSEQVVSLSSQQQQQSSSGYSQVPLGAVNVPNSLVPLSQPLNVVKYTLVRKGPRSGGYSAKQVQLQEEDQQDQDDEDNNAADEETPEDESESVDNDDEAEEQSSSTVEEQRRVYEDDDEEEEEEEDDQAAPTEEEESQAEAPAPIRKSSRERVLTSSKKSGADSRARGGASSNKRAGGGRKSVVKVVREDESEEQMSDPKVQAEEESEEEIVVKPKSPRRNSDKKANSGRKPKTVAKTSGRSNKSREVVVEEEQEVRDTQRSSKERSRGRRVKSGTRKEAVRTQLPRPRTKTNGRSRAKPAKSERPAPAAAGGYSISPANTANIHLGPTTGDSSSAAAPQSTGGYGNNAVQLTPITSPANQNRILSGLISSLEQNTARTVAQSQGGPSSQLLTVLPASYNQQQGQAPRLSNQGGYLSGSPSSSSEGFIIQESSRLPFSNSFSSGPSQGYVSNLVNNPSSADESHLIRSHSSRPALTQGNEDTEYRVVPSLRFELGSGTSIIPSPDDSPATTIVESPEIIKQQSSFQSQIVGGGGSIFSSSLNHQSSSHQSQSSQYGAPIIQASNNNNIQGAGQFGNPGNNNNIQGAGQFGNPGNNNNAQYQQVTSNNNNADNNQYGVPPSLTNNNQHSLSSSSSTGSIPSIQYGVPGIIQSSPLDTTTYASSSSSQYGAPGNNNNNNQQRPQAAQNNNNNLNYNQQEVSSSSGGSSINIMNSNLNPQAIPSAYGITLSQNSNSISSPLVGIENLNQGYSSRPILATGLTTESTINPQIPESSLKEALKLVSEFAHSQLTGSEVVRSNNGRTTHFSVAESKVYVPTRAAAEQIFKNPNPIQNIRSIISSPSNLVGPSSSAGGYPGGRSIQPNSGGYQQQQQQQQSYTNPSQTSQNFAPSPQQLSQQQNNNNNYGAPSLSNNGPQTHQSFNRGPQQSLQPDFNTVSQNQQPQAQQHQNFISPSTPQSAQQQLQQSYGPPQLSQANTAAEVTKVQSLTVAYPSRGTNSQQVAGGPSGGARQTIFKTIQNLLYKNNNNN